MAFSEDVRIQALSPTILDPIAFHFIGCIFYGNPFHTAKAWSINNEIGRLWTRYMKIYQKFQYLLDKINLNPDEAYEIHFETDEYKQTQHYYVFVGMAIEFLTEVPLEFFHKPLPPVSYLSFHTKVTEHDHAEYLFREYLQAPNSPLQQAYPYLIQKYNSKRYFGLEDPRSEIEWLIPIIQKPTDASVSPPIHQKRNFTQENL